MLVAVHRAERVYAQTGQQVNSRERGGGGCADAMRCDATYTVNYGFSNPVSCETHVGNWSVTLWAVR